MAIRPLAAVGAFENLLQGGSFEKLTSQGIIQIIGEVRET